MNQIAPSIEHRRPDLQSRRLPQPRRGGVLKFFVKAGFITCYALVSIPGNASLAQDNLSPRLQIGIHLLPAIVAANKGLVTTDASQDLPVYLVYRDNRNQAEQIKPGIARIASIRHRTLKVITISLDALLASELQPHAVIFITGPMSRRLPELNRFAQRQQALLFSPFEGDVERGVTTGFQVTDKVLPLINMDALVKSKIQLKAFFLRIAVKYE